MASGKGKEHQLLFVKANREMHGVSSRYRISYSDVKLLSGSPREFTAYIIQIEHTEGMPETYQPFIHPDDLEAVIEALQKLAEVNRAC